jgi:tetratricopeptide (TPR) repeat protein
LHAFNRLTKESNIEACRLFERALELDPNLADAYAGLTRAYASRGIHRLGTGRDAPLEQAIAFGEKALNIDEENVVALAALALAQVHLGHHAVASHYAHRAIELNPNYSHGYVTLAVCHLFVGRPEDALSAIEVALRLNPLDPQWYARLAVKASALYLLGRYGEAVQVAEQSRGLGFFYTAVRVLAAAYAQLGFLDKAQAAANELISRRKGDTTIAEVVAPFVRAEDRRHYADALRKAGLPES